MDDWFYLACSSVLRWDSPFRGSSLQGLAWAWGQNMALPYSTSNCVS